MHKITSLILLSAISQSSINAIDDNKIGKGKSGGNETNLSNLSPSKKFTGASYLTFEGVKKGGDSSKKSDGNTKKAAATLKRVSKQLKTPIT